MLETLDFTIHIGSTPTFLYRGECDLMVHLRKYSVIFSRMHFVTFVYNMHQDMKISRLIAVCKRSFSQASSRIWAKKGRSEGAEEALNLNRNSC